MKIIINILILASMALGYMYFNDRNSFNEIIDGVSTFNESTAISAEENLNDITLNDLYQNQISGTQVMGSGKVIRLLPTDNNGSRHQRFIIRLASGQTLLISHNIDLAPTIASLATNDDITFYGEYEWNAEGGVVHWTHRDPAGRHTGGWIVHDGETYR